MIEVVAAVIKNENKYLIAKRAAHKLDAGKWEFPGGKIEIGETPDTALKRELLEELGIETVIGSFIKSVLCDIGHATIKLMAYEVKLMHMEFQLSDHDEIIWVSIEDITSFPVSAADLLIIDHLRSAGD